jgi:hypothetical protein
MYQGKLLSTSVILPLVTIITSFMILNLSNSEGLAIDNTTALTLNNVNGTNSGNITDFKDQEIMKGSHEKEEDDNEKEEDDNEKEEDD